MPFCPNCYDQYEFQVEYCPNCYVRTVFELVDSLNEQWTNLKDSESAVGVLSHVANASNASVAKIWARILLKHGICTRIVEENGRSRENTIGPYSTFELFVLESDIEKAKEILGVFVS